MNSKLSRPFRAPREVVDRSKARKVKDQLDVATQQPPSDPLLSDSEEATELGLVWKHCIVKETQDPEVEPAQKDPASDKGKGTTSEVASPNLSEFERFLDLREKTSTKDKVDSDEDDDHETFGNLLVRARLKRQSIAASTSPFSKIVLARPDDDQNSRVVDIDDITPDATSDDDEVPIVRTMNFVQPKREGRTKAQIKWTYESVAESTGAASKYWDAAAPTERASKRLAKEKLVALKAAEADPKGIPKLCCLLLYKDAIHHIYCFHILF
jgi:hypothetical protein